MNVAPGTKFGAYEVVTHLGSGGMGDVYRAIDSRLDRPVALKLIRHGQITEQAMRRFDAEARAASALNHPGIVTIYEFGSAGDVTFIAMELADGQSLRDLLDERGPLPVELAVAILEQLVSALSAAHRKGVIHRDLKPANIMISRDGARAKILDFGLAKRVDMASDPNAPTVAQLTQPGAILGTPAYMAPEQARGVEADARSDQFSLGVIAYEMLTGSNPFARPTPIDSISAIVRDPVPPLPRPVPAALRETVARMLAKDAGQRFADMESVARALQGAPHAAPRRGVWWIAAALAVALIALLIWNVRRADRPAAASTPAVTPAASTESVEDAYIRSRYLREEYGESDPRTIAALEEVVRRDPRHARAWALLSRCYTAYFFYKDPSPVWEQKAFVAIEKALALDDKLADAYVARATLLWTRARGFPHREALRDAQHAIRLDPQSAVAHGTAALILMHVGLAQDAKREIDLAHDLQPSDKNWLIRRAYVDLFRGSVQTAAEEFADVESGTTYAMSLNWLGRTAEAERVLAGLKGDQPLLLGMRSLFAAKRGDRAAAERLMQEAIARDNGLGHFHHVQHVLAETCAVLGETERSIEFLEGAAKDGFPSLETFDADPELAPVRRSPRYRALAVRLARERDELRKILTP